MSVPALVRPRKAKQLHWLGELDRIIAAAEAAEIGLSSIGGDDPFAQRKASGSYYTPADVAEHFWTLFFRHHQIRDLNTLLAFLAAVDLVEPSAGSGIFVFTFLKKAALLGARPEQLTSLRFHVVDINLAALRFFSERLKDLENFTNVHFYGIGPSQNDFLKWIATCNIDNLVFAGNPPFITNPKGARWRNAYADFLEAMLRHPATRGISLILPLSICFSRDYSKLRELVRLTEMGISISSYDNMPDYLFKVGKPDSTNTNRANSQRCTILNMGGPNSTLREASPLLRWTARERASLLASTPRFHPFDHGGVNDQLPRPVSDEIVKYMHEARSAPPLRTLLTKVHRTAFNVGAVARNFIGIREPKDASAGTIPIKVSSKEDFLITFQILSSPLFYDYWRSYGDGFHVTVDLIERFPITDALVSRYRGSLAYAMDVWKNRAAFAKEKSNAGQIVRSYDFRSAFSPAVNPN